MKKLLLSMAALFVVLAARAQSIEKPSRAQERAQVYASALGLDADRKAKMAEIFAEGEKAASGLYAEQAKIEAAIEEAMAPYDKKAMELLSAEERKQLETLCGQKSGTPTGCCSGHGMVAKSSDNGKGTAVGGCCAGHGKH